MKLALNALLVSVIAAVAAMQPVMADVVANNFKVTMEVKASCVFTTAAIPDLGFGSVNANQQSITGTTAFGIECTKGTAPEIKLLSANSWKMKNTATDYNTEEVAYKLHSVSASGPEWNESTGVVANANGSAQTFNVYGSVASAGHTKGSFSDTVTVNLTF